MGLSSSSSKVEPWKEAQAPILAANSAVAGTYNTNAPKIQGYADQIGGLIPGIADKYRAGDPAINASRNYITQTLGQTGGNPYLQQMIDQSGQDTGRAVSASMGVRGLTGGSVHEQILAHELGKNAMGLRYNDYNNQQQMQAQAAGMAPGVAAGDAVQLQGLLAASGAASGLPMDAASRYAGSTGGLLSPYTTTKSSLPWGAVLANAAGTAASAFAGGK